MPVEPHPTALHRAVKLQCSCPHVGIARVGLGHSRQHQGAVALLHQAHSTAKGSTCKCMGVKGIIDGGVLAAGAVHISALHPRRSIVEEDIGSGTVCHTDSHISGFAGYHCLVVEGGGDATIVCHLGTSLHGE